MLNGQLTGAFSFDNREDAEKGLEMIHRFLASFGLEIYIGQGEQPSKTEVTYIPKSNFYTHESPQYSPHIKCPSTRQPRTPRMMMKSE
jgi:hypothetical protein